MVRWTQLNALMPALQFSIAPWDLSEETAKLCAQAVALRKKVLTPQPAHVPSSDSAKHKPYEIISCLSSCYVHI